MFHVPFSHVTSLEHLLNVLHFETFCKRKIQQQMFCCILGLRVSLIRVIAASLKKKSEERWEEKLTDSRNGVLNLEIVSRLIQER